MNENVYNFSYVTIMLFIILILFALGTTIVKDIAYANPVSHSNLDENFTITNFGVNNNNPFLTVRGQAGGTLGDSDGDLEFAYMFHTDKGLFSASSAGDPYVSAKNTQKIVQGKICLKSAHPEGHVSLDGHKLTITGININRLLKVEADEDNLADVLGNNCIDQVISHKP